MLWSMKISWSREGLMTPKAALAADTRVFNVSKCLLWRSCASTMMSENLRRSWHWRSSDQSMRPVLLRQWVHKWVIEPKKAHGIAVQKKEVSQRGSAVIVNTYIFQARDIFFIEFGFDPVRDCGRNEVNAAQSQGRLCGVKRMWTSLFSVQHVCMLLF